MMNWLCGFPIILIFHLNFYLTESFSCLKPADARKRPIPFNHTNEGISSIRLPSGTMGIITSYKFHCCGTISSWKTYIYPQGNEHYDGQYNVDFQVWRPSKTVLQDGCYRMIGYSRYSGVLGYNGLISKVLNEPRRIKFQAGDVVGIFIFRIYNATDAGRRSGLMLDTSYGEERVWYHVNVPNDPLVIGENSCPLPVGPHRKLRNFINAAPLLSVQVAKFPCNAYKGFTLKQAQPVNISMSRNRKRSYEKVKKGGWTNLIVAFAVTITIMVLIALLVLMAIGALENRNGKLTLRFPPWDFKKVWNFRKGNTPERKNKGGIHAHKNRGGILHAQKSKSSHSSYTMADQNLVPPRPDVYRSASGDIYFDTTEDDRFYLSSSLPPESPKPKNKEQFLTLPLLDGDSSSHYLSPNQESSKDSFYSPHENDNASSSTQEIRSGQGHSHRQKNGRSYSHRPKDGRSHSHRPKDGRSHSHRPKDGQSHFQRPKDGQSHSHRPKDGQSHSHRPKDGHSRLPHSHRPSHQPHQDGHSHRPKDGHSHLLKVPQQNSHSRSHRPHQDGHSHQPKGGHSNQPHQDGHSRRPKDDHSHRPHQDGHSHRPKDGHSHRPQDGQPKDDRPHQDGHRPKDDHSHRPHQDGHSHRPKDGQPKVPHQDGHSHQHAHSKDGQQASRHRDGHSHSHRSKDGHHSRHHSHQDENSKQGQENPSGGDPSHSRQHANRHGHSRRSQSGNHLAPSHGHRKKFLTKHDIHHQESSSSTGTPNPFPEIPTQVRQNLPTPMTPETQASTPQASTSQSNKPFILMTPELLKMAGKSSDLSSLPVHVPGSPMTYPQLFTSARSQAVLNTQNKK